MAQIPSKIGSLFNNQGNKDNYKSLHAVDALFTEPDGDQSMRHPCLYLWEIEKKPDLTACTSLKVPEGYFVVSCHG